MRGKVRSPRNFFFFFAFGNLHGKKCLCFISCKCRQHVRIPMTTGKLSNANAKCLEKFVWTIWRQKRHFLWFPIFNSSRSFSFSISLFLLVALDSSHIFWRWQKVNIRIKEIKSEKSNGTEKQPTLTKAQ